MTKRYSAWSLVREALNGQRGWSPAWLDAAPKSAAYDAIVIGGGGHGLATAYYLAKNHGLTNVALVERGWIGGGNTGRNTTVIRSNYFYPETARFFDFALQLYESLSRDLNYNIMFSQRGMWVLGHDGHGMEIAKSAMGCRSLAARCDQRRLSSSSGSSPVSAALYIGSSSWRRLRLS